MDEPGIRWRIPPSEESEPSRVERALRERIKELNCLYAIAQLADREIDSMEEFLPHAVSILPPSWQFPEITCARITFDGSAYRSGGFRVTRWRQTAPIRINNETVGEVAVFYKDEQPPSYEGPFLREERALIDAVAESIGNIAKRLYAEKDIQEMNRQLTVERKALQETNTALRMVLARIEEEKREICENIHANVGKILMPILHALAIEIPPAQKMYVDLLRENLEGITSPFIKDLAHTYDSLTPTEVQICDMIRSGMRTKDIARLRGVSTATVNRHRERIRRKLGIANRPVNLATHLQSTT